VDMGALSLVATLDCAEAIEFEKTLIAIVEAPTNNALRKSLLA
jgi:hypothetical protein